MDSPVTTIPVQMQPEPVPVVTEPVNASPTAAETRKQLNALLDGMTPEEIQAMHRIALEKQSESRFAASETLAPIQAASTPFDSSPKPDDGVAN
jgi:hypothetical protein